MKIFYFLDDSNEYGGAVHTILQQAYMMKKAGHQIRVFKSDYYDNQDSDNYLAMINRYEMEIERVKYQVANDPENLDIVCVDKHYEDLLSVINQERPDILHSVQLNPIVELISRELNIPHVMNIYPLMDIFFETQWMDVFPHYLTCDSEYWANQWKRFLGVDYRCIRTVTTHFMSWKKKKALEGRKIHCICVGAIYEGKNQLEVIKGFHKAIESGLNADLSLYGNAEGEYAHKCREYVEMHSLSRMVKIMGFHEDMHPVYTESDILICGSIRESYPNAVSEAMANGLIVLSTPVGGVPEIVQDDKNGYLTKGFAAEEICDALIRIHHDILTGKTETIRRISYETALKEHSPQNVSVKLEDFYKYVIQDNLKRRTNKSVMIQDVRKEFCPWLERYQESMGSFEEPLLAAEKIWYLKYMEPKIKEAFHKGRDFYVWGAGRYGRLSVQLVEQFFHYIDIKGIMDSRAEGVFMGHEIIRPEKVLDKGIVVFVGLGNGQWDVIKKLETNGKKHGLDYFLFAPRTW